MRTNANILTMREAIKEVQQTFPSVAFRRLELKGKWIHFTLKAKSGEPGSRNSASGRHLPCASWDAHGMLFDAIFKREPTATIWSLSKKQTPGHWEDWNVGSRFSPVNMSELSNC